MVKNIKIKPQYWNFFGRILALIMFGLSIGIIAFIMGKSTEETTVKLISYAVIMVVLLLIIRITKQEPNNLEINNDQLVLRSFPFLWKTTIPRNQIKGYSTSTKSYSADSYSHRTIKHPVYVLYLRSGKKYHFINYYFIDFKKIPKLFRDFGVKNLGQEKEVNRFLFFRKYKF